MDTLVILKHTSASGPKADGAQGPKSEAAEEEMAELDEPVQQRGRQQNSKEQVTWHFYISSKVDLTCCRGNRGLLDAL